MKKVFAICFIGCFASMFLWDYPVLAAKQKYTRHYQKKTQSFQKKNVYSQPKDLPDSASYLEVSRKMPKVSVVYQPQNTAFSSKDGNVLCRGVDTFSCTYFGAAFSVETDCSESRISLKVVESPKMTVELSSLYPKGSCRFDRILKHELTHVDLYRKSLNVFIKEAERKLSEAYVSGQRESKGCKDVTQRVSDAAAVFAKQFAERMQAENVRIDTENGEHKYGLELCSQDEDKDGQKIKILK
ncbi:MAG: hypothetical protein IKR09_00580 [Alphaproteobacteria bacterium]|nr:hypothetical protein [Alphaproteobacteria bacterium]